MRAASRQSTGPGRHPVQICLCFWGILDGELAVVLQKTFSSAISPALPAGMLRAASPSSTTGGES